MNDNEERPVTIITGRVWRRKGGKPEGVHVMLVAPDDASGPFLKDELSALLGSPEHGEGNPGGRRLLDVLSGSRLRFGRRRQS